MRTITLTTQAWGTFAVVALALSMAHPVAAQDCASDSDCDPGNVCHHESGESCSGQTCKPGVACPPPVCQPYDYSYCQAAPCTKDADCPSSMLCYAQTYTECSGSGSTMGCAPDGGDCTTTVVDAGSECHDVTGDATCTARYAVPCHADIDCGAGFVCEEQQWTVCSTGGTGAAGMGTPSKDVDGGSDYECHTENSGQFACRLLELPCSVASDCAAGLECQPNPNSYMCAGGFGGSPATMGAAGSASGDVEDAGVAMFSDGGSACAPSTAPSQVCAPHNYYSGGDTGTSGGGSAGKGGGFGNGAVDGGVGAPSEGSGSGGQSGGGTTAGGGSAGSGNGNAGSHHHDHAHLPGHLPRFGCAVSDSDARTQLSSWSALVGMVSFGLRRRARRSA